MKNINVFISYTITDENINRYFNDIRKIKILKLEEEKELIKRIQNGDKEAFDKLVVSNLRFVVTVAKQYQNRGICLSDLICEGNCGLIKAAREFNPNNNVRFITYAVWWIKNYIVYAIYAKTGHVYIPVGQTVKLFQYNRCVLELTNKLGKDPTNSEIATKMGISESEVKQIAILKQQYVSLDKNYGTDDQPITLENLIPAKFKSDSISSNTENIDSFNEIINCIPDNRSADIVRTMFGIGTQTLTLEELSSRFNISSERVRQLKEYGINWLKKYKQNDLKDLYD